MIMKKEDYIALGKWVKGNSYLQIPAEKVDEYFEQLERLQSDLEQAVHNWHTHSQAGREYRNESERLQSALTECERERDKIKADAEQRQRELELNASAVVALTKKLDKLISFMESVNRRAMNGAPCTDIQAISADALKKAKEQK